MKRGISAIMSVTSAIILIVVLLISAPAQAFVMGIDLKNPYVKSGQKVAFNVSTGIEEGEELMIEKFSVELSGPETINCDFLADGTPVSDCKDITIKIISNGTIGNPYPYGYDEGEYGYGDGEYGYGYKYIKGVLGYSIEFNSKDHKTGMYGVSYLMNIDGKEYKKDGNVLFVYDKEQLEGCSVRASRGTAEESSIGRIENARSRINFNFPLKNAVTNGGSLQIQTDKTRINYEFEIVGVLENNPQYAKILISGKYRVGINESKEETSVIYIEKKEKKITLTGKGLTVTNMELNLLKNCK